MYVCTQSMHLSPSQLIFTIKGSDLIILYDIDRLLLPTFSAKNKTTPIVLSCLSDHLHGALFICQSMLMRHFNLSWNTLPRETLCVAVKSNVEWISAVSFRQQIILMKCLKGQKCLVQRNNCFTFIFRPLEGMNKVVRVVLKSLQTFN